MTIALIGPSGAGKGTQASRIVSHFELLHISTGDLFRESLERRTALGFLAKRYMNEGSLVPDEVVDALIEEWLWKASPNRKVLFDGFPGTLYQANFLDKFVQQVGRNLDAVMYLNVPDDEIIARLPQRIICRSCQTPYHPEFNPPAIKGVCDICHGSPYSRPDDTPEIIRRRLKVFHRVTKPLIDYYKEKGLLIVIDGTGPIRTVTERMVKALSFIRDSGSVPARVAKTHKLEPAGKEIEVISAEQIAVHSRDLVLFGPPGSGKGTQATMLRGKLGLQHIATGDLFRENLRNETELGELAKTYMDRGELVPDDVTEGMVKERLGRPDTRSGFLLDGFPRTLAQAEALTEMLNDLGRALDAVVYIKVSDEEIVNRLSGRRICRACQKPYHIEFNPPAEEDVCNDCGGELYQRTDDNPITVAARLKSFHGQTTPLIEYYNRAGLLVEIDGEGDMNQIAEQTLSVLTAILEPEHVGLATEEMEDEALVAA